MNVRILEATENVAKFLLFLNAIMNISPCLKKLYILFKDLCAKSQVLHWYLTPPIYVACCSIPLPLSSSKDENSGKVKAWNLRNQKSLETRRSPSILVIQVAHLRFSEKIYLK
jgi:hypothetical protein